MTTDSALMELIKELREHACYEGPRIQGYYRKTADRIESILVASASQQPAPAGMVLVLRSDLERIANMQENDWPGQGADDEELSGHWFSAFQRKTGIAKELLAAAAPPPTLNEAFDQVGAAMRREVCGEGAPAAQETRADGAIKCNACGGWNKPWQPGHIDCCDHYSAPAAQVTNDLDGPNDAFAKLYEPDEYEDAFKGRTDVAAARVGGITKDAEQFSAGYKSGYEHAMKDSEKWAVAPAVEIDEAMKRRAAGAIANARAGRRGAPAIANVLDILPLKLLAEVVEDAEAALVAALKGDA